MLNSRAYNFKLSQYSTLAKKQQASRKNKECCHSLHKKTSILLSVKKPVSFNILSLSY